MKFSFYRVVKEFENPSIDIEQHTFSLHLLSVCSTFRLLK
jgi:hypothetical protein